MELVPRKDKPGLSRSRRKSAEITRRRRRCRAAPLRGEAAEQSINPTLYSMYVQPGALPFDQTGRNGLPRGDLAQSFCAGGRADATTTVVERPTCVTPGKAS